MKKVSSKIKRKLRKRKKIKSVSSDRYRISITKSLKNLSAQIIDDKQNKTLVSASSIEKEIKNKKMKKKKKILTKCISIEVNTSIMVELKFLLKL